MKESSQIFPLSGIWWSPSAPKTTIRGSLHRPSLGQTILSLNCLSKGEYELFNDAEVIHGMSSSGHKLTLLECFTSQYSQAARADSPGKYVDKDTKFFWNIEVFVNYTLFGLHILDSETPHFKSVNLKSEIITHWGHNLYHEHRKTFESNAHTSIIFKKNFNDGDLKITIMYLQNKNQGVFNENNTTDLQIALSKNDEPEISLNQSVEICYPLIRLLTFLCNTEPKLSMLELIHGDHDAAQVYLNEDIPNNRKIPHIGDVLSISDLEDDIQTILTTWYRNYNKYNRMSRLFRQTLNEKNWHDEELISAYVRILETILGEDNFIVSDTDSQLVETAKGILRNIEDQEVKDSYLSALGNGKKKGNKKKFSIFIDKKFRNHPYYTHLLESLKHAVNIRNDDTHLNDFKPSFQREILLKDLSIYLLQTLIKLRLLEQLGIPEEKCQSLFESHSHFFEQKLNLDHYGKLLADLDNSKKTQ